MNDNSSSARSAESRFSSARLSTPRMSECERASSQKASKPPAHRSGHSPWIVHDVLGPTGGEVSQNWVCRKWPDGWLMQHVLSESGGGEGLLHERVGGFGQEWSLINDIDGACLWSLLEMLWPWSVPKACCWGLSRDENRGS